MTVWMTRPARAALASIAALDEGDRAGVLAQTLRTLSEDEWQRVTDLVDSEHLRGMAEDFVSAGRNTLAGRRDGLHLLKEDL